MKKYVPVILLFLGCIILFGSNAGDLSLLKGDENYYFSSARQMIRDGDWVTPRYHHRIRFEKPILYYWIVAIFFKLFGVSWVTARATSVLFGALTVLITYLLGIRLFDKKRGMLSAVMLATTFLFFQYCRLAVIDAAFLFLVTLSLYFFIKGERENPIYLLFSFVPLGLSILAKGPLGLAVFVLVAFIYAIIAGRRHVFKSIYLYLGMILLLVIALPWPLKIYRLYGQEYINHIWQVETVGKTVGPLLKLESLKNIASFLAKYLGYYVPVVIFAFVPWGVFLPFGLCKKIEAKREDRVFILTWFWGVFLLFTLVSFKHTHYLLLLCVPLCMITANFFSGVSKKIPIAIAALTVIFYLSLTGLLLPRLNDGALKRFSLTLAGEIRKDEQVALGSRNFNLKKLGIHLNNLVSTPYELSGDDLARYKFAEKGALGPFLASRQRVYCLITKKDYITYVPKGLRERLYILETSRVWRRFKLKGLLPYILNMDLTGLKEEAYLISNRR